MSIKTKKVSEVPVLEQATSDTYLLAEKDGTTHRIPAGNVGGGTTEGSVDLNNPPLSYLPSLPVCEVVDTFQDNHRWKAVPTSNATATIEDDTEDYLIGNQSVHFTNCIQADNLGLNITGKHIRMRFKINSIDAGANLSVYLAEDSTFTKMVAVNIFESTQHETHRSVKIGEWTEVVVSLANTYTTTQLDTVGTIRFKFLNGEGDANIQMIALQNIPSKESKGIVSFTFDDGIRSVYTKAAKILGARGIPGTTYIISDVIGVNSAAFTEEQVRSLKCDYGWDIESHGASRLDDMTDEEIIADFAKTKKWIQDRGLGSGDHYAYPNGVFDDRIKNLARKYFTSARTIDYISKGVVETTTPADPYAIRAISAIGESSFLVEKVKENIDMVAQFGGWLILVFHHIGDEKTDMYCSEAELAEIADYAVASGVDIKTVADVLR